MIVIALLKSVMIDAQIKTTNVLVTQAFLKLFNPNNELACNGLFETAIQLIDEYMTPGKPESVENEPDVLNKSKDVKGYMRWEKLGKNTESSPKLMDLLALHQRLMKRGTPGQQSPFDLILAVIKS